MTTDIRHLTISELCAAAGINRTTFYKYYGSQYDLLEEIQQEFFAKLEQYLVEGSGIQHAAGESISTDSEASHLGKVLEYLAKGRDRYSIMINAVDDETFLTRLFSLSTINQMFQAQVDQHMDPTDYEYLRTFLFHGCYSIIKKWMNSDTPEPAQDIAAMIYRFSNSVLVR